jgi:hypothetical protein
VTGPAARRPLFRSIVALVGGFAIYTFVLMLLMIVTTVVLSAMPGTPIAIHLLGTLTVTLLAAGTGGYAAAALAPSRQYGHAVVLSVMVLLASTNGMLHPLPGPPPWFPFVVAAIGVLGALGGGLLRRPRTLTVPVQ